MKSESAEYRNRGRCGCLHVAIWESFANLIESFSRNTCSLLCRKGQFRNQESLLQRNGAFLIWVWIWDSEHPLHAAHADAEANSGDYYLRPVLAPEDTDPEQGTIMISKCVCA